MNYVLGNIWRGEAKYYWHDTMSGLKFLLGSALKTSGGHES